MTKQNAALVWLIHVFFRHCATIYSLSWIYEVNKNFIPHPFIHPPQFAKALATSSQRTMKNS